MTYGTRAEREEAESELRPMTAGELFSIPADGCDVGDACDVAASPEAEP